jgi:hypothetical protein
MGFTSPSKEGALQIAIALKNPSPSAGFELRTLAPMANMITTRPPKVTVNIMLRVSRFESAKKHYSAM